MPDRILIVDDEASSLDLLERELGDRGYATEPAQDGAEALRKSEALRPDLVLLDCTMPGMNGLDVLKALRAAELDMPVVVMTAQGSIEAAVQAMKLGAYNFIQKPFEPEHVALTIQKALEYGRLKREAALVAEERDECYRLVAGESALMGQAIEVARQAAAGRATVLLLGESGTGKETLARAIHYWSDRRQEPFIPVNCAGPARELLESQLFGHENLFTGAHRLKKGKMELAHRGTVLLDEIGEVPPDLQAKLLRFLQERDFERVGGTKPISVDVRIIAATNRDLDAAVNEGRFREDLYHRLNVGPITVPALRERREDIPDLARHFVERFSRKTKKRVTAIAPEAMGQLVAYSWPGNIRELANVIERALVLGQGPTITTRDLPPRVVAPVREQAAEGRSYQASVNAYRRELIVSTLARTGGNRAAAASALGLHRTHLMRLLKVLGIE